MSVKNVSAVEIDSSYVVYKSVKIQQQWNWGKQAE